MLGAHSDTLLLVHVIWATVHRTATLRPEFDGWFAGLAADVCRRIGCDLLAAGNGKDHVHVLLRMAPSIALSDVAGRLKGTSSHAWNARASGTPLRWQTGYWARSIEQESLGPLVVYVREQRVRHAATTTLAAWEQHEATLVPIAQDEDA